MTPLEKALQNANQIDYCTQCEFLRCVNNAAYCSISGKMLHPYMYEPMRGLGYGPARRCKQRQMALTKKKGN